MLTRGQAGVVDGIRRVTWDAATLGDWVEVLDGADAVVHLSGKRVDCLPTRSNLAELVRSRVEPVRLVGRALTEVDDPPAVWVQSATLAIHGDGGDRIIVDDTPVSGIGPPQMVQVAMAWEHAVDEATADVERTVVLRIGVTVGGRNDPATERLATLVRLGLGGSVGSGRQWFSWIGLDDVMAGFLLAIDDPAMHGTYNLTSPNPVRNDELMAIHRRVQQRSVGLPAPAWVTRIGAPLLGSDPALALTGRRAIPQRLLDRGFTFQVTDLEQAVADAVALQRA